VVAQSAGEVGIELPLDLVDELDEAPRGQRYQDAHDRRDHEQYQEPLAQQR
jgi:hypothetical protein